MSDTASFLDGRTGWVNDIEQGVDCRTDENLSPSENEASTSPHSKIHDPAVRKMSNQARPVPIKGDAKTSTGRFTGFRVLEPGPLDCTGES